MFSSKSIGDKVTRKLRKGKKRTVQAPSDVDTESEPVNTISTKLIMLNFHCFRLKDTEQIEFRNLQRKRNVRLLQTRTMTSIHRKTGTIIHRSIRTTNKKFKTIRRQKCLKIHRNMIQSELKCFHSKIMCWFQQKSITCLKFGYFWFNLCKQR